MATVLFILNNMGQVVDVKFVTDSKPKQGETVEEAFIDIARRREQDG